MPADPVHVLLAGQPLDGWHEVAELDVERDVVRLRRKENDDGPALEEADEEERLPSRCRRWHEWLAS
ncbi:MAG: hypothetical protein KY451_09515 [Actinobacteria bacterium]|nr:hypothetical protein [Actinomycetota bacterium]MBW3648212.1 hypothetical protein [Actinomycetota bacterium]